MVMENMKCKNGNTIMEAVCMHAHIYQYTQFSAPKSFQSIFV